MIAKHVPMRSAGKSDFAGLVRYITDKQSKEHRLGNVYMTNCDAETVRDAITEILATQQINTRAKGDKTYHLIVSFRAGEQPSDAILKAVEERISAGLGYGEHQRIMAVHNDTDNLHLHIAINKIHPRKNTIHEPYYSHRTLSDLCSTLEQEFGLERDNHMPRQCAAAARANDMECHAGIESLVGWIKRECLDAIRGAQSWAELHQQMRDNGLELALRGNGLLIKASDGTMVKASTVSRDLSKPALEKRLGSFQASTERHPTHQAQRSYCKEPARLRVDTTELYARYKQDQKDLLSMRAQALAEAQRRKVRAIENAKRAAAMRRSAIKLLGHGRLVKKLLYSQASAALRTDLEVIRKNYIQERSTIYQLGQRRQWLDWLKHEAMNGNEKALDALRARDVAQGLKGNTIQGQGNSQPARAAKIDNITKKGTIIYRAGSCAVRDDGYRLQISKESDQAGVQQALKLAMDRYGDCITVNGSPEFKAKVIKAAVDGQLAIRFADTTLERYRQELVSRQSMTSSPATKATIPPIGKAPPPMRRNRLHTLSQLAALSLGNKVPAPQGNGYLDSRKAKLQAEMEAKKANKQNKGRSM